MTRQAVENVAGEVDLEALAAEIGGLHRLIEMQPSRYSEMHTLLTKAKKEVGHGGWLKWLAAHEKVLGFGVSQAGRYLEIPHVRAENQEKRREHSPSSYNVSTNEAASVDPLRDRRCSV